MLHKKNTNDTERAVNVDDLLLDVIGDIDVYLYVTDPETDEIIFISESTLKNVGCSMEDALGKKCWQVLQVGMEERCNFCRLDELLKNPDKPVVWEDYNTRNGRYYRNTDKMIKWHDGRILHLQHFIDITDITIADATINRRIKQQELTSAISQSFISEGDIALKINSALSLVADFFEADIAFVSKFDREFGRLDCFSEWHQPDTREERIALTSFDFHDDMPYFHEFNRNSHAVLENIESIDHPAFDAMKSANLRSIMVIPIMVSDALWGLLGFYNFDEARTWSANDINLGRAITGVLSGVIRQRELKEDLLLMSAIVNYSPSYITYTDAKLDYLFFNSAITNMTGYSPEELLAGGTGLLFDERTTERVRNEIFPEIMRKGRHEYELTIRTKWGEERIMAFSSFTIDGKKGFATIANDVTERRMMERDLLEANEAADRANRSKSEFLSRMSHEMRTPLNAIIGMTNIAMSTEDYSKKDYSLQQIDTASKHLLGLINDILDMSKIEANKLELYNSVFDLYAMLEKTKRVLSFSADKKQISLTLDIARDVPRMLTGDEMHLTQIINNLLSNAIKFTHDGGHVSMSVFNASEPFARRQAGGENEITLLFEVADDGIGLSKEQQSRLFRSFEQADGSITRKYGGTGLGLAISKHIVGMMGGEIWVESEPGIGSKFSFTARLAMPPSREASVEKGGATAEKRIYSHEEIAGILHGKNIILAEDVEINREIVCSYLEDTGINLDHACNGVEAVQMFEDASTKYDLILMDIQMPEMNGFEATKKIRASACERAKRIPIIAMTANAFKEDIANCFAAGMNDHIGKPVDWEELLQKLAEHLS